MPLRRIALAGLLAATAARADQGGAPPPSKKELLLASKAEAGRPSAAARDAWHASLERRIEADPEPVINIYNTWTREFVAVSAAGDGGASASEAAIDSFLRCHFTNQAADMDPRLFRSLVAAARHFKSARVDIVSGFRSPKFNLILRKKGREVARESQHTRGHAVDFRLRGVSTEALHRWARKLGLGGVGYYPGSAFIHIDVGPVRYWTGQ